MRPLRKLLSLGIAGAVLLSWYSCGEPAPVDDLLARFEDARKQPANTAFEIAEVTIDGSTKRAIIARGHTRLTFHVTVPKHAVLRTSVALPPGAWDRPGDVLFLIGASDGHSFQSRGSVTLDAFSRAADRRWRDLEVSLEEYAGLTIDVVLNTRVGAAADEASTSAAIWGAPMILAR